MPFASRRTRCALTAPFHPCLIPHPGELRFRSYPFFETLPPEGGKSEVQAIGGLFSVALFLASRRAVISRHPTLWSPDFPLRAIRTIV